MMGKYEDSYINYMYHVLGTCKQNATEELTETTEKASPIVKSDYVSCLDAAFDNNPRISKYESNQTEAKIQTTTDTVTVSVQDVENLIESDGELITDHQDPERFSLCFDEFDYDSEMDTRADTEEVAVNEGPEVNYDLITLDKAKEKIASLIEEREFYGKQLDKLGSYLLNNYNNKIIGSAVETTISILEERKMPGDASFAEEHPFDRYDRAMKVVDKV